MHYSSHGCFYLTHSVVYLVYWTITKNISFLRVLVYTTQCIRGTCDNELYKLMFYLLTYLLTGRAL